MLLIAGILLGAHAFGGARPRVVAPARGVAASRVRCTTRMSTELDQAVDAGAGTRTFSPERSEKLPLPAKERLWLESIAAYYNDEKPLLSDEDYARLKLDLEFEASKYVTMSAEELKFVIASSRYREGKPIMSDVEYDTLRKKLKNQNSAAAIHEAPTCRVDTGVCKSDAVPDQGKNAVLYLPGTVAATVLWTEALYWTQRMDPLIAAILGSPLIYLIARLITEKILFQNPLIVSATCPNCQSVINLYFGDVLGVDNQNVQQTEHDCPVCKTKLRGSRDTMIVQTVEEKRPAK
ncbi:hypothetical protein KFE25_003364 [Diacronema lutheri]|uniref:Uncharacterized protein n=2 Tax=Diacronema lutheri TaxID=2081491 RepID=A0A8J6CAP5_DIALT|nr:hypothetical protein KFE25_003364 [Diacronema lutheri]